MNFQHIIKFAWGNFYQLQLHVFSKPRDRGSLFHVEEKINWYICCRFVEIKSNAIKQNSLLIFVYAFFN